MALTTNYSWVKPTVGGSADTWGTELNTLIDNVDSQVKTNADAAVQKANNGSDFANIVTTRTNLGLAIGTNVQAFDAGLQSIAGLTTAADQGLYLTGADTYAVFTFTAAGRALLDDADAAAQRTTLGLGTAATQNTGTSGAVVPLLSTANTWSGVQTFSATAAFPVGTTYNSQRIAHVQSGAATNTGRISWGTASPGTLAEGEIYLQYS